MVQDPQTASGVPSSVSNPRVVRGDDGRYYAVVYTDKTGIYGDLLPENYHLAHSRRHTHHAGKHLHGRHHHGRVMYLHHTRSVRAPVLLHHFPRAPFEDPDEARLRQLAIAINRDAGWIGTWQGIAEWYGASLLGAGIVLSLPAAGLWLNEALLGPLEGRLFWSGWLEGARVAAIDYGDGWFVRVISQRGIGWALEQLGDGPIQNFLWRISSRYWAVGALSAAGPIEAFIGDKPGVVWQETELPILWTGNELISLFHSAQEIIYRTWK